MNKEIAKKAFESAQYELENETIKKLKEVVKETLLKVKKIDEAIDKLQEEKKILKLDLEDLKEGRLDRIEERQKADKLAKAVSVITVEKEVHHHHYEKWYEPYKIYYTPSPSYPFYPAINCTTFGQADSITTAFTLGTPKVDFPVLGSSSFTATSSLAKFNTVGTYDVDGKVVHLR